MLGVKQIGDYLKMKNPLKNTEPLKKGKNLSQEYKMKLLTQYHRNESRNYHSENALMLIEVFGTKKEKIIARKLKKEVNKLGYVPYKSSQWFYKYGHSHYSKLL